MPISTVIDSGGIPVKVYLGSDEIEHGLLFYREDGPSIILDHGGAPVDEEVTFSFQIGGGPQGGRRFDSNELVQLKPEVITELDYSPNRASGFQMYPPSSDHWLQHVVQSGTPSIFTVQRIKGKPKNVLSIVEKESFKVLYFGLIHSYETSILSMNRDWNVHNEILYSDATKNDIFDILAEEPPSWKALSPLIEGLDIQDFSIKETMEDTLSQLVPESFPSQVRKQIMVFLNWLEHAKIPNEDPIDFVNKYRSVGVFRALIRIHIQCLLDEVTPPKYTKIMQMADRGELRFLDRPRSEAAETDLWNLVRENLNETIPSWRGRVVRKAIALQDKGKIAIHLPVTRTEAKSSRNSWSDRYAMVNHTLYMRGFVNKETVGLIPAIYSGAAHRWPHKHLEWTSRLGYDKENPQYIQVMTMPSSSLERVSRILPTVRLIDWEMSSFNLNLYNEKARKWNIKSTLITSSLERKRSIRQLTNEFGKWRGKTHYTLSKEGAIILDLISWGIYLSSLETGVYSKYYKLNNEEINQELTKMLNHGVFALHYFLIPEKLRPLCIQANGSPGMICSLSRAFLKYTPSSQIRITQQGKSCVITSRVPEDEFYNFAKTLNDAAKELDITLKVQPISAYTGYRNNLYSRLLKEDGMWDDDVSGLLSQVRIQSKTDLV